MCSGSTVVGVDVSIGYQWLKEPIITSVDALTFKWDDSIFYDDGLYATSNCMVDGEHLIITFFITLYLVIKNAVRNAIIEAWEQKELSKMRIMKRQS